MFATKMLAGLALAVPMVAAAQVEITRAYVTGDPPVIIREPVPTRDDMCLDRRDRLSARLASLERERTDLNRESDAIAAETARLADEAMRLDRTSAQEVINYNARSDAHNRRVQDHNARVAHMNTAASLYNGDLEDTSADCGVRIVSNLPRLEYRLR